MPFWLVGWSLKHSFLSGLGDLPNSRSNCFFGSSERCLACSFLYSLPLPFVILLLGDSGLSFAPIRGTKAPTLWFRLQGCRTQTGLPKDLGLHPPCSSPSSPLCPQGKAGLLLAALQAGLTPSRKEGCRACRKLASLGSSAGP